MDETRIIELERLNSAVLLARGCFHQFGNLLTLVGGYASLVKLSVTPGSEEEELLSRIDQAVKQASSLLDDTHRFVRGKREPEAEIDCREVVTDVARLLEATFPRLRVPTSLPGDPARIVCSSRDLFDALMHLAFNSTDAMDGQGVVRLSVQVEGDAVIICVADDGPGIPVDRLAAAMESWSTSRGDDGIFSTGLGLPAVRAITDRMGGQLSVENAPGGGLLVRMTLRHAKS